MKIWQSCFKGEGQSISIISIHVNLCGFLKQVLINNLLRHGKETCGSMSISSKVDRHKNPNKTHERKFYNCELIILVFDDKMVEINSSNEPKSTQIDQEIIVIKFKCKGFGTSREENEEQM